MDKIINVEDVSRGVETCPIPLDNPADVKDVLDFVYVKCNIPGPDTSRSKFAEQIQGCMCFNAKGCVEGCTCIQRYGSSYKDGKINGVNPLKENQNPIFECNRACKCSSECEQRVVQSGVRCKLSVFRTEKKGFGLKTVDDISQNTFICEYAGEVLTPETAKQRTRILRENDCSNYIFVLKEHLLSTGETLSFYVDPMYVGNIGRFINHSCEPNLFMVPVRINHTIPHLALFALRDIAAGEELSFDYSGNIRPNVQEQEHQLSNEDELNSFYDEPVASINGEKDSLIKFKKCYCGTTQCRGLLPFEPSLYD